MTKKLPHLLNISDVFKPYPKNSEIADEEEDIIYNACEDLNSCLTALRPIKKKF